jgi:hypothetical protein
MAASDGWQTRKRGLKLIGLAILLLVVLLVLFVATRPGQGPYALAARASVHAGWMGVLISLALGLFHLVVGAPGAGPFRNVRTVVALVVGIPALALGVLGTAVLHGVMTDDGSSSGGDFDWD